MWVCVRVCVCVMRLAMSVCVGLSVGVVMLTYVVPRVGCNCAIHVASTRCTVCVRVRLPAFLRYQPHITKTILVLTVLKGLIGRGTMWIWTFKNGSHYTLQTRMSWLVNTTTTLPHSHNHCQLPTHSQSLPHPHINCYITTSTPHL